MKQLFWRDAATPDSNKCQLAYICKTTGNDRHFFRGAHAHSQISEITFILNGKSRYFLRDKFFNVKANEVIFCSQGLIHEEGYLLPSICIGLYGDPFSMIGKGFLLQLDQSVFTALAELAKDAYHLLEMQQGEIVENLVLNVIVPKIYALIHQSGNHFKLIEHTVCPQKINLVKQYIDHHFQESVNINHLSSKNNSSRSYVEHRFKDHFRRSPINYLTSRRIGEAQTVLICRPNYPITHIAFDVGFNSLPQFDHAFVKVSGISPSAYRSKYS